jgi:hypothetical protein
MTRRRLITLLLAILLGGSIHAAAPNFVCLLHTTLEVQDQPYVIYFGPGSAAVASRFRPTLIDALPSWRRRQAGE